MQSIKAGDGRSQVLLNKIKNSDKVRQDPNVLIKCTFKFYYPLYEGLKASGVHEKLK